MLLISNLLISGSILRHLPFQTRYKLYVIDNTRLDLFLGPMRFAAAWP